MPITVFVDPIAGDITVEWICERPTLVARLDQLIRTGFRFFPAEQIGQVIGEVAVEGVKTKDRDIADLIKTNLVRVIDVQGGWETKPSNAVTAEEAAGTDTIAIRASANRSSRWAGPSASLGPSPGSERWRTNQFSGHNDIWPESR